MSAFGSDVAEAVGKEFAFFHANLTKAISNKIPVLHRLCADDPRNRIVLKSEAMSDAPINLCIACGRKGDGTSDEVPLDQLIDSASLVGLIYSMGTVVNSHLSTNCSRLQKHGQSLAALSHDSYVDIVHTKIKDIPTHFLGDLEDDDTDEYLDTGGGGEKRQILEEEEQEEEEEREQEEQNADAYKATLCNDGEEDSLDLEDFNYLLKVMTMNKEPSQKTENGDAEDRNAEDHRDDCHSVPELVAIFNSDKFENQLTRIPLSGGSLHAQTFKYNNESPYINQKDMIPETYKHSECECVQAMSALLQKTDTICYVMEKNGMVQESKLSSGSI